MQQDAGMAGGPAGRGPRLAEALDPLPLKRPVAHVHEDARNNPLLLALDHADALALLVQQMQLRSRADRALRRRRHRAVPRGHHGLISPCRAAPNAGQLFIGDRIVYKTRFEFGTAIVEHRGAVKAIVWP